MFRVFEWPWELNICLLDVVKNDFGNSIKQYFK
jgi:hypothetical protein